MGHAKRGAVTMSGFVGTMRLVRLAVRRDRITLPAWILGMAAFLAATTAMFEANYASHPMLLEPDTRIVVENPGMRVLGLVTGPTVGGYALHRDALTLAVLAALMSILAVVRHTRQAEELGRAEMLGAGVVGRYASLAAAVIVALAANVVLALMLALAMVVAGQPVSGSLVAGASIALVGIAFTGVAAVTSQLALHHPRGDRARRCGPRPLLHGGCTGEHARDRGLRRAAGHQRLAGLAVSHRLGPADAAVR